MNLRFLVGLAGVVCAWQVFLAPVASGAMHTSSLIHGMAPTVRNGSGPSHMVREGNFMLFWATDPAHGKALRRLDLTTGLVNIVWDFNLSFSGESGPNPATHVAVRHGWLIILLDSIWRTDGTPEGTSRILQWERQIGGSDRSHVVHHGIAYFGADDFDHGHELWRSDGTPEGTWMVKDLWPRGEGSQPNQFAVVGDRIFFAARDSQHGEELWVSDGTAEGTRLVADLLPGDSGSGPRHICGLGETAFFVASAPELGRVLWRSDGTPEGTHVAADAVPDSTSEMPEMLTTVGDQIFFTARTSATGRELWRTDGTAAGTRLLRDLWPGPEGSDPDNLSAINGRLVFTAWNTGDVLQRRLFVSNGTAAGTAAVQQTSLRPQWPETGGAALMADGSAWFVAGSGNGTNLGLWRTDGTVAGTRRVHASTTWSAAGPVLPVDGMIYLAGGTLGVSGPNGELWRWDIKGQALHPVANLTPEGWKTPPTHPLSTQGGFFFRGYSAAAGFELWRTLGTPATTGLVKDIFPGATGSLSNAEDEKLWEGPAGRVYFQASTAATGAEFWTSDGTTAGTVGVRDIVAGPQGSFPTGFVTLGERVVFAAAGELWSSDGTAEGTGVIKQVGSGQTPGDPEFLTRLGDRVLFVAHDVEHGVEIWTTDGTEAGTRMLQDIYQGSGAVWPRIFGVAGDQAFFEQHGTKQDYGLYATDGTAEGTRLVSNARPYSPKDAAALGNTFFFVHAPVPDGQQVWRSDGTTNGTTLVKAIESPRYPDSGWRLTAAGDFVFFHVRDMELGDQLWRSDGTETGTVRLTPETPSWDPIRMVEVVGSVGRHVYFAATTYRHGRELWVSDGTAEGTRLALDLAPGEASSLPRWVGRHGDRLLAMFAGDPETQSPSVRSLVPPDAAPVFLGLALEAWEGQRTSLSVERLRSLVEAPPDTDLQLLPGSPQSATGGAWILENSEFKYTPPAGYAGSDSLTFTILWPAGPEVSATIQVTVQPRPAESILQPALHRQPAGSVEFLAYVLRGQRYSMERSIDLRQWTVLEKRVIDVTGVSLWIDPSPPSPTAHYRLRSLP